jgi:lipopolysaccharide/colanic/teichoic acid biosynthesis glycosyltransferase
MSGEAQMALPSWVRRIFTTLRSASFRGNGLYLDEKSFRFELARERVRVDRNASPLAVLTIELPSDRATSRDFDFLGRLLVRRLRITDTVGFLAHRVVGVLLPDTSKSGAWKVASDICAFYAVGHDRPNCEVYVYPDEHPHASRHDGGPRDQESADKLAPTSIDGLLAQGTPAWKRIIDVLGAMIGLITAAPLLMVCAAAIKLTSPGPALYAQEREGLGGRRFRMYKLRTMRVNADEMQAALRKYSEQDGPAFKMTNDPRTTWLGRWLRVTSLDELPQLWNVLRGEMSLVGPRPLPTGESLACERWQRQRLLVAPGMTCFWQVSGRNTVAFDQWMRMDVQYLRQRSLWCDLFLIFATAPSILFKRGPR